MEGATGVSEERQESLKGEASESPVVHAPYYPKVSY